MLLPEQLNTSLTGVGPRAFHPTLVPNKGGVSRATYLKRRGWRTEGSLGSVCFFMAASIFVL